MVINGPVSTAETCIGWLRS